MESKWNYIDGDLKRKMLSAKYKYDRGEIQRC
jgi:hypothetical protein